MPANFQNSVYDRLLDGDGLNDIFADEAVIEWRTGSRPSSPDDSATGTLVVAFELGETPFDEASAGVAALLGTPIEQATVAAGTVGWCRIRNAGDTTRIDLAHGDGFTIDNPTFTEGQTARLASLAIGKPS